jgi:hypothetical protein
MLANFPPLGFSHVHIFGGIYSFASAMFFPFREIFTQCSYINWIMNLTIL